MFHFSLAPPLCGELGRVSLDGSVLFWAPARFCLLPPTWIPSSHFWSDSTFGIGALFQCIFKVFSNPTADKAVGLKGGGEDNFVWRYTTTTKSITSFLCILWQKRCCSLINCPSLITGSDDTSILKSLGADSSSVSGMFTTCNNNIRFVSVKSWSLAPCLHVQEWYQRTGGGCCVFRRKG